MSSEEGLASESKGMAAAGSGDGSLTNGSRREAETRSPSSAEIVAINLYKAHRPLTSDLSGSSSSSSSSGAGSSGSCRSSGNGAGNSSLLPSVDSSPTALSSGDSGVDEADDGQARQQQQQPGTALTPPPSLLDFLEEADHCWTLPRLPEEQAEKKFSTEGSVSPEHGGEHFKRFFEHFERPGSSALSPALPFQTASPSPPGTAAAASDGLFSLPADKGLAASMLSVVADTAAPALHPQEQDHPVGDSLSDMDMLKQAVSLIQQGYDCSPAPDEGLSHHQPLDQAVVPRWPPSGSDLNFLKNLAALAEVEMENGMAASAAAAAVGTVASGLIDLPVYGSYRGGSAAQIMMQPPRSSGGLPARPYFAGRPSSGHLEGTLTSSRGMWGSNRVPPEFQQQHQQRNSLWNHQQRLLQQSPQPGANAADDDEFRSWSVMRSVSPTNSFSSDIMSNNGPSRLELLRGGIGNNLDYVSALLGGPPGSSRCPSSLDGRLVMQDNNQLRSSSAMNIGAVANVNQMQIRCKFGQLGPIKGQFNAPHGFCLGAREEEIIVADTQNHRIQVFDKNGLFRYMFGHAGKEEGGLWYPRKVAVLKRNGHFVVCDRGSERSRMQIFSAQGAFIRRIAIRFIDIVAGLAISHQGHIVAVDSVTPTIFVLSEGGDLLRYHECSEFMNEPSDIAIFGREYYICDFKGHNVVVVGEDGNLLRRIGNDRITCFPNGIDISDAGDVLVGDSHGNQFHVAVFDRHGSLVSQFQCPHVKVSRCCGLKITTEGYIVTLAKNNHHVLVLNTLYVP